MADWSGCSLDSACVGVGLDFTEKGERAVNLNKAIPPWKSLLLASFFAFFFLIQFSYICTAPFTIVLSGVLQQGAHMNNRDKEKLHDSRG